MNRKDKIALLNGILKGETPISAVFNLWPEINFYEIPYDEDHYETEDGEVVSFEEVDQELMNYPKVRIISKEPKEKDVRINIGHKYINEDGEEVENQGSGIRRQASGKDTDGLSNPKILPDFHSDDRRNLIPLSSPTTKLKLPPEPPPDPKPPPEPFLSRKDREVLAQGPLYCVR